MNLSRHTYSPEEFIDLGGFGEHQITFIYSADEEYEGGKLRRSVTIWSAIVTVKFGEQLQLLDVTKKINESSATRKAWEDEIYGDFYARMHGGVEEGA